MRPYSAQRESDGKTVVRPELRRVAEFADQGRYIEETILPSVRAPHEGASCLKRLAAIALAAA